MKGLLAASAIALLAAFAVPGSAGGAPDPSAAESQLAAAPVPPPTAVSSESCALRSDPPHAARPVMEAGDPVAPEIAAPCTAGRGSILVSALLLEKHRGFRESLTSP